MSNNPKKKEANPTMAKAGKQALERAVEEKSTESGQRKVSLEKVKNILGSNSFGNGIQVAMAVLTLLSLLVVYDTLREMKIEREYAYRPLLVLEPVRHRIEWDSEGNLTLFDFSDSDNEEEAELSDSKDLSGKGKIKLSLKRLPNDSLMDFHITNIGEGIAKDINAAWIESNTQNLNSFLTEKDSAFSGFCTIGEGSDIFTFDETLLILNKERPARMMYLQPNLEKSYAVPFPAQYSILAAMMIKNRLIDTASPVVFLAVNFSDLENISYWEMIGLSVIPMEYEEKPDGSGSASFQFAPDLSDLEVIKGKLLTK